jgi:hypothetical protein
VYSEYLVREVAELLLQHIIDVVCELTYRVFDAIVQECGKRLGHEGANDALVCWQTVGDTKSIRLLPPQ